MGIGKAVAEPRPSLSASVREIRSSARDQVLMSAIGRAIKTCRCSERSGLLFTVMRLQEEAP